LPLCIILAVCINFKGFSRDDITSIIALGHIVATFMFKTLSCGFSMCSTFQYVSFCRSVNNIVFLSIEYVEFCANKIQFAGSFVFLLPFEEKSTNAIESLW